MRIIWIPTTTEGWVELLIGIGVIIAIGLAIAAWQGLFPSATKKLLKDDRYRQALRVYSEAVGAQEEPTLDDRREAFAAAAEYLVSEHGIPSAEAARNMRLMVAVYDRDQSYDLRNDAAIYEEAGDYQSALVNYERAARLQEQHDRKDYDVLQRCIARVRRKIG
jgi:tetratricopeptide (TPR) repeat protein